MWLRSWEPVKGKAPYVRDKESVALPVTTCGLQKFTYIQESAGQNQGK